LGLPAAVGGRLGQVLEAADVVIWAPRVASAHRPARRQVVEVETMSAGDEGMAPRSTPLLLKVAAIPTILVVEVAGLLLVAGALASSIAGAVGRGFFLSIGFGAIWIAVGGFLLRSVTRGYPDLRTVTRVTWLGTALIASAFFAWTSFRVTTVNETVARGVPASHGGDAAAPTSQAQGSTTSSAPPVVDVQLASGRFRDLDENASGNAAVVRLAHGGQVLTLTDFSASNGPDVRVYLVAGRVNRAADVHDKVDLGGLKGNRGDQQYAIPDSVDLSRYSTVVIYCRSFSVAFGAAELAAS
jgi:hypothetical protein